MASFDTEQGCFEGLVSGEGEVQSYHTLHLPFSEGCCNMQLFVQDRKDGFGKSAKEGDSCHLVSGTLGRASCLGMLFPHLLTQLIALFYG